MQKRQGENLLLSSVDSDSSLRIFLYNQNIWKILLFKSSVMQTMKKPKKR